MPTLEAICRAVQGELRGPPDLQITGVGSLQGAGPEDLAPVESRTYLEAARASKAGALLVARDLEGELTRPRILSPFPLAAMNAVIELLGLRPGVEPGIHATAVVDPDATLGHGCAIGPYAVVGPEVEIGDGCTLGAHVVVERGVRMGSGCVIEAGAVLHQGARLGNRVVVGAHSVISRHGFGYAAGPGGPVKLLHVGSVVLEDDVHIGALCAVDRARYDETRVGRHSAVDNLVHIAHNCTVGQRSFLAAQVGLAGNAFVGSDCKLGGQVGIGNRSGVGDRCGIGAKSGVHGVYGDDLDLFGYPALEKKAAFRLQRKLRKLVEDR